MTEFKVPDDSGGLKEDEHLTKGQIDEKARHLLAQMSLKEKIQQMSGSTPLFSGLFEVWLAYNNPCGPIFEDGGLARHQIPHSRMILIEACISRYFGAVITSGCIG